MFNKGCSFRVKALETGQVGNLLVEYPWNVYDIRLKEIRNLLISTVSRVIREMPLMMITKLCARNAAMREYKCYSERQRYYVEENLVEVRRELASRLH